MIYAQRRNVLWMRNISEQIDAMLKAVCERLVERSRMRN